jgi:cysteine synthase A
MAWTDIFSNVWNRLRLPTRFTRDLLIGIAVGITFSLSSTSLALLAQGWRRRRAVQRIPPRPIQLRSDEVVPGVIGLIGACYDMARAGGELKIRQYAIGTDKFSQR